MACMSSGEEAIEAAFQDMTKRVGGDGGAISISKEGKIGIGWNSTRMGWAYGEGGKIHSGCNKGEDFVEDI